MRDNIRIDDPWTIRETAFDKDLLVTNGSNFMTGNGYLGYRGTLSDWGKEEYVGCVVTDTYDNADGKWTELCTVPNGLYLRVVADGTPLSVTEQVPSRYSRTLNYRYGLHSSEITFELQDGTTITIHESRFASYADLHLLAAQTTIRSSALVRLEIQSGIDGDVWSLNGEHLTGFETDDQGGTLAVHTRTQQHGIDIVVGHRLAIQGDPGISPTIKSADKTIMARRTLDVSPESPAVINSFMSVYTSNDVTNPLKSARDDLEIAASRGYHAATKSHQETWDTMWNRSAVRIEGDERAQALLNYNMYHNFIATPMHSDRLPIGARGLSCQAYQGAAFWDQEVFNLPMFLFTMPEVARNILVYRHKTLDGARKKANDLGFSGAFYAWVSGDTGEEICPSYFFKDVLTGRRIRNHFNDWQIHISPDIAYTVWRYYQATNDMEFLLNYGAEMVFEIASFLVSRAHFKKDKNRFEFIRVLGPDEYHENVDNSFFTNFQARHAAEIAVKVHALVMKNAPDVAANLQRSISLDVEAWQELADLTYVPEAAENSGLIEQFDGFFQLEDITPEELKKRLLDPGEYWGWPNGIAVGTQVSKQADVTQLFMLHPNAFPKDVIRSNLKYYEPRTQHGSSLSPSVYAIVGAWVGEDALAYDYFMQSCSIDLLNTSKAVSGGTFIGGIHTAACGVAWQIAVMGFLGLSVDGETLGISPNVPKAWSTLSCPIAFRGASLQITVHGETAEVLSAPDSQAQVSVRIGADRHEIRPGQNLVTNL